MERRRPKLRQIMWVLVAGVGNVIILISIVSSMLRVSAPHPSDPVQKYTCGSVRNPEWSRSDSPISTNNVCEKPMAAKRSGVFWLTVTGFMFSTFGIVMFMRSVFYRKKPKVVKDEKNEE